MSKRSLPPISALIPFDAAARLGSMSAAARELGISQPAISRHLQLLERDLGQVLFQRNRRGLALTAAGRSYHQAVTAGLDHIGQATQQLRALTGDQTIRLTANFGFTQQWLMPRLARLRAAFPKVLFRLQTSDLDDDLSLGDSDLAIRFGGGQWSGWHSRQLLVEEVFPIAAPAYLAAHPAAARPGLRPADLPKAHLLHMDEGSQRWLTWAEWLRLNNVTTPPERPRFVYSTYPLLLQATLAGEGISLGWGGLVESLLASGSVVQLLPALRRAQRGYFVTFRQGHPAEKVLRRITDWFMAETDIASAKRGTDAG